ncbi:MAG: nucleoside hydrolase, partial [Phycisphaerae bacterium]
EFNFYRDPLAARRVLTAGRPGKLTTLDVTHAVYVDDSHVAHLAAGRATAGHVLARILEACLDYHGGEATGLVAARHMLLHDPVAVAGLLWPRIFIRARVGVEITTEGPSAGQSRPVLGRGNPQAIDVQTAVAVVDFLENFLETICREPFVV